MNKIAIYNFQTIKNIEHVSLKVQLRSFLYIYVELCDFLIAGLRSPLCEQKILIFTNIIPNVKTVRYNKRYQCSLKFVWIIGTQFCLIL